MTGKLLRLRPTQKWLGLLPILLGVACVAGFVISKREIPRVDLEEQALSLPVLKLDATELTPWATGFGTAAPSRTWAAVTEVKGRIVETHPSLDSGQRVTTNELLLRIDGSDYQLRLNQRSADLDAMAAKLAELEASVIADTKSLKLAEELQSLANDELKRAQVLQQRHAASQSDLDAARSSVLHQSKAVQDLKNSLSLYPSKIASAKAGVALVEAQVQEAERDLARTEIRSPFNGVLSGVRLEPSQIVGQHQRLFEVQDDHVIEIAAQFSLAQLEKISPRLRRSIRSLGQSRSLSGSDAELLAGLTAEVVTRSGNLTHRWTGEAMRVAESVDEQTRTLGIIIRVSNGDQSESKSLSKKTDDLISGLGKAEETATDCLEWGQPVPMLRSGSFCEVTLFGQPIKEVLAIPRTAIDGDVAYVIDQDNRLRARPIEIGFRIGELVTVVAGLNEGDLVAARCPVPAIDGNLTRPQLIEAASSDEPSPVSLPPASGRQR